MSKKRAKEPHIRSAGAVDRAVGLKIRQARLEADLSQSELGEKLGVSFQQVQKYEKGTNRVTPGRLIEISKALGKSMAYFLEEPNYKPNTAGERIAQFAASRLGHQLLEATLPLNPAIQQSLVNFARSLSKEAA